MLIRALTTADLDLFRELRLRALASDPGSFGGTYANESQRTREQWAAFLAKATGPGQTTVVAFDDERPLGMCGAFLTPEDATVGMIWGMFVEPSARGSGVADALIATAEEFLRSHGARRVTANVSDCNARAIAFYRRRGYAIGAADEPLREGSPIRTHPIEKPLA